MQRQPTEVKTAAVGRWTSILPELGVPSHFLTGKHGPCPCCGGTDRFRFTDLNGNGSYYCNGCGPGDGLDLVMKVRKIPFAEAKRLVAEQLPQSRVAVRKATDKRPFDVTRIWSASHAIMAHDPVGKYLASRGLVPAQYPTQLRYHPRARYVDDDTKQASFHPAMVANFVSPDGLRSTVHYTYLTDTGRKADLAKVKKLAPAPIPKGGAVRLDYSAETMGIAEGIETALAAAAMFDMPVWSALSAPALISWEPPAKARQIIIYADNDGNYTGQAAAYALAHRLRLTGLDVLVKVPDGVDADWADVWKECLT
jgi:putative DNA primase/helicase